MGKYTSIGGQALIEGIMMKSPEKTALSVRTKEGIIDTELLETKSVKDKIKILKLPILRGIIGFAESMIQGYKAMMISAEKSGFTDLEEEDDKSKKEINEPEEGAENSSEEKEKSEKKDSVLINIIMVIGTVLAVALSIVLFMYIPRLVVSGLQMLFDTDFSKLTRSFIEQFIKLSAFVLYVWAVSFMKDIKRVFMYHGAEHKTIFCYEKGLELTVENVRKQKRLHPRCGTSFMILMILVSIIISTVTQIIFPQVYNITWLWVITKILLIPITCGIGYEVLKMCGKYDNFITRIISAPGLWLQKITTKEPEDDMIEIAIAALKACEPENPDVDRSCCCFDRDEEEENQISEEN